jgi:hypothetical protein
VWDTQVREYAKAVFRCGLLEIGFGGQVGDHLWKVELNASSVDLLIWLTCGGRIQG